MKVIITRLKKTRQELWGYSRGETNIDHKNSGSNGSPHGIHNNN